VKTLKNWCDCAFIQPLGVGQLEHGGTFFFSLCVLVKSQNQSWTRDFLRFHPILKISPDFTHFLFFQTIQHAKHVLTHKIVWFYESKYDFNNLDSKHLRILLMFIEEKRDYQTENKSVIGMLKMRDIVMSCPKLMSLMSLMSQ
jgi:hypothetical protein